MEGRACEWCKGPITSTRANVKYCGATCRTRAGDERKKRPCLGGCGRLRFTAKGQAVTCNECRVRLSCGTVNGYRNGCRCQGCKDAACAVKKEYDAKYKEKHGISYRWRNGREGCYTGIPISRTDRLAIYDRDGWTCQLCFEPVYWNALEFKDQPSLDHIIPQSATAEPDHSPNNLRLAHVGCNARRKDAKHESIAEASEASLSASH